MAIFHAQYYKWLWLALIAMAIIGVTFVSFTRTFANQHISSYRWHQHRPAPAWVENSSKLGAGSEGPTRHVYFLKTHKCASTTIQRVVLRYGLAHNLSIALPLWGENVFYPDSFRPEITKVTQSHPYFDIMASHTRYHVSARTYMPNDTTFLSVVRDPAEQMESAYYYFHFHACKKKKNKKISFEVYMENLTRLDPNNRTSEIDYVCSAGDLRFLQLYDFGLSLDPAPTKDDVIKKIREIEDSFHLILVVEKIDEGLIMMRDMLKWTTEDILYLKNNFRLRAGEGLSAAMRLRAYNWNWADKMLYDHFKSKMETMIKLKKDYIESEVREFRRLQAALYQFCIQARNETASGPTKTDDRSREHVESYALSDRGKTNYTCQIVAMSELQLFKHLNSLNPYRRADPVTAAAKKNAKPTRSGVSTTARDR